MTTDYERLAAADLLDEARDVLAERGWCQNVMQDSAGRVCLERAVEMARLRAGLSIESKTLAAAMWELRLECGQVSPYTLNDLSSTTLEDVVLVAKKAAHALREAAS